MHPSFHLRLAILLAAALALLGGVAFLAHQTWTQAQAVRVHFRSVENESGRVAERVRVAVQAMDTDLLRYKLGHDPSDWERFSAEVAALRDWLSSQRAFLQTEHELALLTAIDTALAAYLDSARAYAGKHADATQAPEALSSVTSRSEALLSMGFELAEAHSETLGAIVDHADQAVNRIEQTVFFALGLLVVLGVSAGWLVYRESIAPLQRELRESRMQLQRQEKLASLGVLSAGIAHEIRNPLTAVKARLFTLRKAVHDDPSAAEDVGVINNEVDRLERIVRDFLRFARPPDPSLETIDPVALLRQVRDLVAPSWTPRGIVFELDETPAPAIRVDRDQIEQVLINLVQNAAEAMAGGGTVRLRTVAGSGAEEGRIGLVVADTGPGIPPAVQARLFDPFFSTKGNGTGLGLALSARIVEKHGGRIRFDTVVGSGTTFFVFIPAAPS